MRNSKASSGADEKGGREAGNVAGESRMGPEHAELYSPCEDVGFAHFPFLPQATDRDEEGAGPAEGKAWRESHREPLVAAVPAAGDGSSVLKGTLGGTPDTPLPTTLVSSHTRCGPASPRTPALCTERSGREPRGPVLLRRLDCRKVIMS